MWECGGGEREPRGDEVGAGTGAARRCYGGQGGWIPGEACSGGWARLGRRKDMESEGGVAGTDGLGVDDPVVKAPCGGMDLCVDVGVAVAQRVAEACAENFGEGLNGNQELRVSVDPVAAGGQSAAGDDEVEVGAVWTVLDRVSDRVRTATAPRSNVRCRGGTSSGWGYHDSAREHSQEHSQTNRPVRDPYARPCGRRGAGDCAPARSCPGERELTS